MGSHCAKNYDSGMDNPIAMIRWKDAVPSTYYYHKDALGSVTEITDSTGAVVQTYQYKTFGVMADVTGTIDPVTGKEVFIENPYTYTSREYDTETGLYYYRARYYNAMLGRFINKDPIGIRDGLNVYIYVGNDPVNYVDPTGEFVFTITGILAVDAFLTYGVPTLIYYYAAINPAAPAVPWGQDKAKCDSGDKATPIPYVPPRVKRSGCKPCDPPVGTIGYPGFHNTHGHYDSWHGRYLNDHYNYYEMQQSPPEAGCKCFWKDLHEADPPPPRTGSVLMKPAQGGGPL